MAVLVILDQLDHQDLQDHLAVLDHRGILEILEQMELQESWAVSGLSCVYTVVCGLSCVYYIHYPVVQHNELARPDQVELPSVGPPNRNIFFSFFKVNAYSVMYRPFFDVCEAGVRVGTRY